jgi:predicted ATPase/class 3 adenylate cyclase
MRERPLPTGTVTFLFSDIEGSTRLVQDLGTATYAELLERHNAILRAAFERHGGTERGTHGDSFLVMFPEAPAAIEAAVEAQRELRATAWPADADVRVRMGVHAGLATLGGDDYVGIDVHRAARIAAAAHGGQIIVSDATRGLVEGHIGGVHLLALGEHELRDLPRAEPLYQVVADGLETAFPPLRAAGPSGRGNLPSRLTTFIGRQAELDELARLMGSNRLITLVGPGGTGKTSLATELLRREAHRFADGTWFVALESVHDPELVPGVLAATFGLVSGSGATLESRLHAFLAPRTLGVIVDNVEQVLDAAPLMPELLRGAPGLTIVATSRSALRVAGEQEYPVQPLPVPVAGSAVDEALANDAIRLFVDRAERVRPGYRLVSEDVEAVTEICRRLDCLPLGIEIAASRMALLPARDIADRLGRRLDLPGSGPRDAPERQRTLQAAIGWSNDLLREPEQWLLERLSVFAGSFAVDQAEAVCGPVEDLAIEVLDGLSTLAEHSLVQPAAVSSSGARFRLLTTVRMFAAERLEARGEAEDIRVRHAQTYLALAEQIAPTMLGRDQARRLDRLALEHDNFRAAFHWAIDRDETTIAMRLAAALWRYWQGRGHLEEGWATVSRILVMPGADPPSPARLGLLDAAGGVAWWQGDLPRADRMYEQQVADARTLGDPGALALALFNRSHTMSSGQGSPESVALRAEARTLFEQVGDARGVARARWVDANLLMLRDPAAAAGELEELLQVYQELDDVYYLAMAAGSLSWSLLETGDLDRSLDYALLSFQVATQGGDLAAAMVAVRQVEILFHLLGHLREAAVFDGAADMLSSRYGITTPPVFTENVLRRWPGPTQLRDAIGTDEFESLRRAGAGMSIGELVALIDTTFAARQAGQPAPAPSASS